MATDDLATQGTGILAAMILTNFAWNNPGSLHHQGISIDEIKYWNNLCSFIIDNYGRKHKYVPYFLKRIQHVKGWLLWQLMPWIQNLITASVHCSISPNRSGSRGGYSLYVGLYGCAAVLTPFFDILGIELNLFGVFFLIHQHQNNLLGY